MRTGISSRATFDKFYFNPISICAVPEQDYHIFYDTEDYMS